jgi:regulator of RNase E activity RraA
MTSKGGIVYGDGTIVVKKGTAKATAAVAISAALATITPLRGVAREGAIRDVDRASVIEDSAACT